MDNNYDTEVAHVEYKYKENKFYKPMIYKNDLNFRWSRRHRHGMSGGSSRDVIDYRTGYIKSHLRSPSGRVR